MKFMITVSIHSGSFRGGQGGHDLKCITIKLYISFMHTQILSI